MDEIAIGKHHRIVAVTPAGRRRYLEILASYVLRDPSIDEWHLWDNCRTQEDRAYLRRLADTDTKVRIVQEPSVDGTNRSVNQFYKRARDPGTFYIKLDDDIVYLPENFGLRLYSKALSEKDLFSWWSPLVLNNAICTYLLRAKGIIKTQAPLTAQANCPIAWGSPLFAKNLHEAFLDSAKALGSNWQEAWKLNEDFPIFLQRFSINAIGFFGELSHTLKEEFCCPPGADDEEHISAVLPLLTGKPGRLIGDILVVHFSFHTQEEQLLKTNLLERYALLAGLSSDYRFLSSKGRGKPWKRLTSFLRSSAKYFLNEVLGYYPPSQKERYAVKLNIGTQKEQNG